MKLAEPEKRARPKKPESLMRNWQIASILSAIAITFIGQGMIAPIRTLYARQEGASGAEAGMMAAAFLFSGFVFLFPFGWLSDRVNRSLLIVGGLAAHMLVTLVYLFATSGEIFITLRFLEGITAAAVMPPARALLADLTPPGRNGEAFGLFNAMITLGMFGGPPVGTFLAEIMGFQPVYLVAAVIFIPSILLVLINFKTNRKIAKTEPEDKPVLPVNVPVPEKMLTAPIIIGCLVKGAIGLGPGVAIAIWSLFTADLGFSLTEIGWTYMVYSIPMILVAPVAGRFSDRYGRMLMMFGSSIALSFMWVSYGFVTALILFIILGIVEGSFDAVARSANDGFLADYSPVHQRGKAQGLFNAVQQFGTLAGALIGGFLYEITPIGAPFIYIGVLQFSVVAGAMVFYLLVRRRIARQLSPA